MNNKIVAIKVRKATLKGGHLRHHVETNGTV